MFDTVLVKDSEHVPVFSEQKLRARFRAQVLFSISLFW